MTNLWIARVPKSFIVDCHVQEACSVFNLDRRYTSDLNTHDRFRLDKVKGMQEKYIFFMGVTTIGLWHKTSQAISFEADWLTPIFFKSAHPSCRSLCSTIDWLVDWCIMPQSNYGHGDDFAHLTVLRHESKSRQGAHGLTSQKMAHVRNTYLPNAADVLGQGSNPQPWTRQVNAPLNELLRSVLRFHKKAEALSS